MFCENCGANLSEQTAQNIYGGNQQQSWNQAQSPQKRNRLAPIVISVLAIIILLAVLLFVVWDKLPIGGKENKQQEMVENHQDNKEKSEENKEIDKTESKENQRDNSVETKKAQQDDKAETEEDVEYNSSAEADINGVDNAYVQVTGILEQKDGSLVLKMSKKTSVCAYGVEDEIVQNKQVEYLALNGEDTDMEEYLGDELAIKGKLSADSSGKFLLTIVKLKVEQKAAEENMDFEEHRYELILDDVTWEEAFADCVGRGGYLVQINSEEEYQSVIQRIEEENMQNVHFYLGGRRERDSREYYWVDAENGFVGEILNPEGEEWAAAHWMENEPSFVSEEEEEMYMNLIYYQEQWVLNDVPTDITIYYPGKTGYICEFDK